jgi:hypothetical protein
MRLLLFLLVSFITVTAVVSGLLMISNPDGKILGLSTELLTGTPFKNFRIPGMLLTVLVGITNLAAVIFNLQRNKNRYNWAMAGGIMITGWIVIQMILINITYWIQFFYLGTGVLIILLAYQLKGKWAV